MCLVFSDNQSCTPRCHTLQSWHVTSAVLWLQPSKCECISKHLSLQDWRRLEQFFFLHISAIVFRTKNDGLFRIWFTNISWNCSKAPKSNTPALHYQFRGSLRQNIQDENENVHRDLKKIWKIKCTKIERQIYFLFPLNFLRSYKSKWYQVNTYRPTTFRPSSAMRPTRTCDSASPIAAPWVVHRWMARF